MSKQGETVAKEAALTLASGRKIGAGHPCFVIAEAGSNWRMGTEERDLQMAHALVDVAVEAGCDAVKFQTYKANRVYVADAGESDYLAEIGIKKSITEIFDDLSMPYAMIPKIAEYCQRRGILFMSTPFSIEDADAVDPYVEIHKIASYEISHVQLQDRLAKTGKPIVFSTGASSLDDVDYALHRLRAGGASQLAMMQCTARYPAPLDTVHARVIPTLRQRFGIPVGLSDHSREPAIAPCAAVALGATLVEKHYTLHNRLPGADHPFALEPHELKAMVGAIRQTEAALGSSQKVVGTAEEELFSFARRGLQMTQSVSAGATLALGKNLAILRPGKQKLGAHPRYLDEIEGGRARRALAAGEGVHPADVEPAGA